MSREAGCTPNNQIDEFHSEINFNKEKSSAISPLLPEPQVKVKGSSKRQLTKAYKLRILNTYDACKNGSERGSLLRREGLYHSHIGAWRKKFGLTGGGSKKGSKTRNESLIREIEQLRKKLAQAEAIIDLQKKVSELLGTHILPLENNGVEL